MFCAIGGQAADDRPPGPGEQMGEEYGEGERGGGPQIDGQRLHATARKQRTIRCPSFDRKCRRRFGPKLRTSSSSTNV